MYFNSSQTFHPKWRNPEIIQACPLIERRRCGREPGAAPNVRYICTSCQLQTTCIWQAPIANNEKLEYINNQVSGRRRKTRCIYSPGDRECILCKSRGVRCIEQGSEDPSSSGSKPTNHRKHSANGRSSKSQAAISFDQPEKLFEDADTSDLQLPEKIDSAPIVSLLVDAKVNSFFWKDSPSNLTGVHSFLNSQTPKRPILPLCYQRVTNRLTLDCQAEIRICEFLSIILLVVNPHVYAPLYVQYFRAMTL